MNSERLLHIIEISVDTFDLIYHRIALVKVDLVSTHHIHDMSFILILRQHIRLMHSRRNLYFIFIRLLSAFVGGYPISLPGSPAPVYYPISPAFHSYDMSATLRGDLQWYLRSIIRPCPFLKLSVNPASRIHRFYRQSPTAAITYITAAKYKFHKASN